MISTRTNKAFLLASLVWYTVDLTRCSRYKIYRSRQPRCATRRDVVYLSKTRVTFVKKYRCPRGTCRKERSNGFLDFKTERIPCKERKKIARSLLGVTIQYQDGCKINCTEEADVVSTLRTFSKPVMLGWMNTSIVMFGTFSADHFLFNFWYLQAEGRCILSGSYYSSLCVCMWERPLRGRRVIPSAAGLA